MSALSVGERVFIWLQHLLPHHALSWVVRKATRWTWRPWKNLLIGTVTARFNVDLSEAEHPDADAYPSFNAFFTRALKAGARPVAAPAEAVACPADGVISQVGNIANGRLLQAKGRLFTLTELLAGDPEWSDLLADGAFLTIYLSPRDYHRVHMPIGGQLVKTAYVPGRLFSVDDRSTRGIDRIFARNERLNSYFQSDAGPMALILVGALMVSSIDTVWGAPRRPRRTVRQQSFDPDRAPTLARGAEMGRFNMGSTVILLFGRNAVRWNSELAPAGAVRVGERIGTHG